MKKSQASKKRRGKVVDKGSSEAAADLRRLFVDPASISTGWSYWHGKTMVAHGTIRADKSWPLFARLGVIWAAYRALNLPGPVDSVHIEQLPRMVHHYTQWSCGVIGHALSNKTIQIFGDIPVRAWQKATAWDGKKGDKFYLVGPAVFHKPATEDERAAIAMGHYYVNRGSR